MGHASCRCLQNFAQRDIDELRATERNNKVRNKFRDRMSISSLTLMLKFPNVCLSSSASLLTLPFIPFLLRVRPQRDGRVLHPFSTVAVAPPETSSPRPIRPPFTQGVDLWHRLRRGNLSELLSFRGGRNPMVKAEGSKREDKGKRVTLPDIPLERSGFPSLFFAVQRRKARREGAFVILNDASSKDRVRVLLVQSTDRENNNVQTKPGTTPRDHNCMR